MAFRRPLACLFFAGATLLASCLGESDTQRNASRTITKVAGDNQSVRTGGTVPIPPKILLAEEDGTPVPDIPVTFAVASGGGTVTLATPVTGADGTAAVGTWVLGTAAGTNTLTATIQGVPASPVTFSALGQSRIMSKVAGDAQSVPVATAVPIKPKVKILDQTGAPIVGVAVTFAVTSGGGTVTGATVATGADGTATVGNWVLGAAAGTNTLTATSTGVTGSPQTFTATATAADRVGRP